MHGSVTNFASFDLGCKNFTVEKKNVDLPILYTVQSFTFSYAKISNTKSVGKLGFVFKESSSRRNKIHISYIDIFALNKMPKIDQN